MSPRKLPIGMDLSKQGHTAWRLVNKVFPQPQGAEEPWSLRVVRAESRGSRKELSAGGEEPAAH